jgi:hypothetical protein
LYTDAFVDIALNNKKKKGKKSSDKQVVEGAEEPAKPDLTRVKV